MAVKYNKWPKNMPNVRKIYQSDTKYMYLHLALQDPSKFTQNGIFGLSSGNSAASHKHDMV
jgi:hypothetical protein